MPDTTRSAFESIVESHLKLVYRIAFRILGSDPDAEDVVQIVFAEAYRLHRNKGIENWTGFLARLATHRSLDLARAKDRNTIVVRDTVPGNACDPHDELVGKEIAMWLRAEVAHLPEQQATVFTLISFEDMKREEVARMLGVTVEAISTALYKARRKLQQRLKHWH